MTSDTIQNSDLLFTGERYIPEIQGNIELEHIHRYLLASQLVRNKVVIDIASGEGYGTNILSSSSKKAIGIDLSTEAVKHACTKYRKDNLSFVVGDSSSIPIHNNSVDVVVSFETIEHHANHQDMMIEIKRILRPGGLLVISSPDKYEYSDKLNYNNPFHVKELYLYEFIDLLNGHFKNHAILGQRVLYGSAILNQENKSLAASYQICDDEKTVHPGIPFPRYFIAVASDMKLPTVGCGILEQSIEDMEYVHELKIDLSVKNDEVNNLSSIISEKDNLIVSIENKIVEKDTQINTLTVEKDTQINTLTVEKDTQINTLNQRLSKIKNTKDELVILNQVLLEKSQKQNRIIRALESDIQKNNDSLIHFNSMVQYYVEYIDIIEKSLSWKFTSPLRRLKLYLTKIFI